LESGVNCFELCEYLGDQLSYAPDWANRFLGAGRSVAVEPVCYRVMVDTVEIVLQMHRYYIGYQAHGQELYAPFLSYEKLLVLDTDTFFLLLPMADVSAVETDSLVQELERRLAKTALPLENIKDVAYFLSIGLAEAPILTIYRESADILYGAQWQQEERLYFFQQEDGMRSAVPYGRNGIATEEEAVAVAKRLLADLVAPPPIDCSCLLPEPDEGETSNLPETVYVSPFYAPMETLAGEAVTVETLNALLVQFAQGGLKRLEFAFAYYPFELKFEEPEGYPRKRSLVFLHDDNRYAVLYFDDAEKFFYVLQQQTESIGALGEEFVSVDKKLPEQCLFNSFFPIQCHLQQILIDSANAWVKQKHSENMGDCKWLASWGGVFVADRRIKYNLAKREIGKFPLERAYNPVELPIAVSDFITVHHNLIRRPVAEIEQWNLHGERRTAEITSNQKFMLQKAVLQFFHGELAQLRIGWDNSVDGYRDYFAPNYFQYYLEKREGKPIQTHIVLRRDNDHYMLLCLQDFCEAAEYYVADKGTYMDVEGKKYPKDTFQGKTMPAYLIHKEPLALRNCLDLLLDYMYCINPITKRFAEFAKESPVKPRDYAVIRQEFVSE